MRLALQEGAEEARYTPVPEAIIGDAALDGATRRIQEVAVHLALRSAATLHTFVQVRRRRRCCCRCCPA